MWTAFKIHVVGNYDDIFQMFRPKTINMSSHQEDQRPKKKKKSINLIFQGNRIDKSLSLKVTAERSPIYEDTLSISILEFQNKVN